MEGCDSPDQLVCTEESGRSRDFPRGESRGPDGRQRQRVAVLGAGGKGDPRGDHFAGRVDCELDPHGLGRTGLHPARDDDFPHQASQLRRATELDLASGGGERSGQSEAAHVGDGWAGRGRRPGHRRDPAQMGSIGVRREEGPFRRRIRDPVVDPGKSGRGVGREAVGARQRKSRRPCGPSGKRVRPRRGPSGHHPAGPGIERGRGRRLQRQPGDEQVARDEEASQGCPPARCPGCAVGIHGLGAVGLPSRRISVMPAARARAPSSVILPYRTR